MHSINTVNSPSTQDDDLPPSDARARSTVAANGFGNGQPAGGLASVPTHSEPDVGDEEAQLRLGREALAAINREGAFERHLLIATGIDICQRRAMRKAGTNEPTGGRFARAMSKQLRQHGFDVIEKSDRSRLLSCLRHRDEIAIWRRGPGARYSHPNSVWRHWQRYKNKGVRRTPLSDEAKVKRHRALLTTITLAGMLKAMPEWRVELERRLDVIRDHHPPEHDKPLSEAFTKLVGIAEKSTAKDIVALVKLIAKQAKADGRELGVIRLDGRR